MCIYSLQLCDFVFLVLLELPIDSMKKLILVILLASIEITTIRFHDDCAECNVVKLQCVGRN